MMTKKLIVAAAFIVLSLGSAVSAYQNLRWHCWQSGGGVAGTFWSLKDAYFYPYLNCTSRWPNFSDHWPRATAILKGTRP